MAKVNMLLVFTTMTLVMASIFITVGTSVQFAAMTTAPTMNPTKVPTMNPTTKNPTMNPTTMKPTTPTSAPTTAKPTTKSPTTKKPTKFPTSPTTKEPTTASPTPTSTVRLYMTTTAAYSTVDTRGKSDTVCADRATALGLSCSGGTRGFIAYSTGDSVRHIPWELDFDPATTAVYGPGGILKISDSWNDLMLSNQELIRNFDEAGLGTEDSYTDCNSDGTFSYESCAAGGPNGRITSRTWSPGRAKAGLETAECATSRPLMCVCNRSPFYTNPGSPIRTLTGLTVWNPQVTGTAAVWGANRAASSALCGNYFTSAGYVCSLGTPALLCYSGGNDLTSFAVTYSFSAATIVYSSTGTQIASSWTSFIGAGNTVTSFTTAEVAVGISNSWWTGCTSTGTAAADTCSDWTSEVSEDITTSGLVYDTSSSFLKEDDTFYSCGSVFVNRMCLCIN